jgi:hypothetical protein
MYDIHYNDLCIDLSDYDDEQHTENRNEIMIFMLIFILLYRNSI